MSDVAKATGVVLLFASLALFLAGLFAGCKDPFSDRHAKAREGFDDPPKSSAPNAPAIANAPTSSANAPAAALGTKTIVYVPALEDMYHSSLSMTSLFEDMFSFTSPHPTVEDRSSAKVCDPFSLENPAVIASVERAIRSLPMYKLAAVRVVSLENANPFDYEEHGCLAKFAFAFASGVRGASAVKASVKMTGCNQWVVTAMAEPESKYCQDFKEKGTTC